MSKFTHKVGQQLSKEYYKLLKNENIDLMMIITNWMLTLMTRCFELEVLGKIWDMMLLCRMEEEFIVKLCVEVLGQFEEQVVGGDGNGFQVLSKGKLDEIKQEKVVDLMQKYGI